MDNDVMIKFDAVMIDCVEPNELAEFYSALLKWKVVYSDDEYTVVAPPGRERGEYPGISFQKNPDYVPPVWPDESGVQQQMMHIDFLVNDLDKAVKHAISCGATVASEQFSNYWKVMFDPSGHPFCLVERSECF